MIIAKIDRENKDRYGKYSFNLIRDMHCQGGEDEIESDFPVAVFSDEEDIDLKPQEIFDIIIEFNRFYYQNKYDPVLGCEIGNYRCFLTEDKNPDIIEIQKLNLAEVLTNIWEDINEFIPEERQKEIRQKIVATLEVYDWD